MARQTSINESLTLPTMPTPLLEMPVDATPDLGARYAVLHAGVDAYQRLTVVDGAAFGDTAALERLLRLGAIAPLDTAIVRLEFLGDAEGAALLRGLR